jgi:hypothetical protein
MAGPNDKFRNNDPQPLGDALNKLFKRNNLDQKVNETQVIEFFKANFSPTIIKSIGKIYITNGSLFLHISSASLRHEFSLSKGRLLNLIETKVGKGIINGIHVLGE